MWVGLRGRPCTEPLVPPGIHHLALCREIPICARRWKETFFVNDEACGLTIAGFYYGEVLG